MLNPAFSKSMADYDDEKYVLGTSLIKKTISVNTGNNTGQEYRLQNIYCYEIWKKLEMLNMKENYWSGKTVLDICCGTGFVSYHLLNRINPDKVILMDISKNEIRQAKSLLDKTYPMKNLSYLTGNAIMTGFKDNSFDIIIGNSFLHHFYSLPQAFSEFKRILKPGGVFVSLHEPSIVAVALEAGHLRLLARYLIQGDTYINSIRYQGQDIAPGEGQDIWVFNETKIKSVLADSGFCNILTLRFHLLRAFFVGKLKLHLNEKKPRLTDTEISILKACADADMILSKQLPSKYFSSICIKGQKM